MEQAKGLLETAIQRNKIANIIYCENLILTIEIAEEGSGQVTIEEARERFLEVSKMINED